MGLFDALKALFLPWRTGQPPAPSPDRPPVLPAADQGDILELSEDDAVTVSALVQIEYRDAKGDFSRRRITIRRIYPAGYGDLYIDAYCHERRAPRSFLASRMISIAELGSGEVFDAPVAFLNRHILFAEDISPTVGAIERCRDDLAFLAMFARCDGAIDNAEKDVIIDHVFRRCPAMAIERQTLSAYVRRLFPDQECFENSLRRLIKGRKTVLRACLETMLKVITADGNVTKDEAALLNDVVAACNAAGVKVSLDV